MKHFYLTATLSAALTLNAVAHADGAQKQSASEPPFIEYHNRIAVFRLDHLSYERIKTNSIYAGVESWFVRVATKHHHHHHRQYLAEGEFRMGYNFFWNGRDHFTPLAGVGYIQQFHRTHGKIRHDKPGIVYGTFGFLYDHEFTKTFNLGVNLKGLLGGPVSEKRFDWGNPVGGIDVSVPFTFRFGYKRRWDIRLEPFNVFLCGSEHSCNYFGGRSTVGFRF